MKRIGRNDPCPCGSTRKYKKCCQPKDEALARQAASDRQAQTVESADSFCAIDDETDDLTPALPQEEERKTLEFSPEVQAKMDRFWAGYEAIAQPTTDQMDQFLEDLLTLPPETTSWGDLLHKFADQNHSDLPRAFRRMAASLPHIKATGMSSLYWAAAEEFSRCGQSHLLPEVAAGYAKLGLDTYDADALRHLEDHLLAEHFDQQTQELVEYFLPIVQEDDGLMPWVVPTKCGLIFDLRVGRLLQAEPTPAASPKVIATELRRGISKDIHPDAARLAAEIVTGQLPPTWAREQFALVEGDDSVDDHAWGTALRLRGALIHTAREAWQTERYSPGCALRGLSLMLRSAYGWQESRREKRKKTPVNLLDCLRSTGLEARVVRTCRDIIGINLPSTRLMLEAHGLLLRSARRHQLISDGEAAQSEKELDRLQEELMRCFGRREQAA